MKIFYIEDENGRYVSADGSKRWTRLTGKALHGFLQTERGKETYFLVDADDNGVAIGVEVANKDKQDTFKSGKRHHRYVSDTHKKAGYIMVSFDCFETEEGTSTGDEVVPNDDVSVEDDVFRQLDLEILRRALDSLTEDEYDLICALYLQNNPMTEHGYSKFTGTPRTTIEYRKKQILQKLKKFF